MYQSRGITKKRRNTDSVPGNRGKNKTDNHEFNGDSFLSGSSKGSTSEDYKQKHNYKKKSNNTSKTSQLGTCNMDDISEGTYAPVLLPMNEKAEALFSAYERAEDDELIDMDSVPYPDTTRVYASREKAGTFCFACSHVGENTPAVADTEIAKLIENMYSLLLTTEIGRLSIIISQQYEERIRKKCNKYLKPGEVGLPHWSPRMVKEHIESHHNDPTFVILLTMCKMKELTRVLFDKCLVKKKVKKTSKPQQERTPSMHINDTISYGGGGQEDNDDSHNDGYQYPVHRNLIGVRGDPAHENWIGVRGDREPEEEDELNNNDDEEFMAGDQPRGDNNAEEQRGGESYDDDEETQEGEGYDMEDNSTEEDIVVCPAVWKMIKESSETYIKLARSCPEKMAFFKEDRYLTKGGNVGHPFFNTNAKIYPASIRKNPSATIASNSSSGNSSSSSKPQTVNLST
jgi:hypothetical protein